jgi:arylsulfatase A-like enzyme
LRTPRHKYVVWQTEGGAPLEEELYDMEADPQETRNLASEPSQAQQLAQLRLALVDQLMNSEKPLMSWL